MKFSNHWTFVAISFWSLQLVQFSSGQVCPSQNHGFELITGYVFTAPEFILDTQPGVLLLEECISYCNRNESCRSINYETGLCVLFTSSGVSHPEALTKSQFPVFTLYAQKLCIRGAKATCPGRAWLFDRVQNFRMNGFDRLTRLTDTREECMALCLSSKSFSCRSATYDRRSRECTLSDMDRLTIETSSISAFLPSIGSDYMENNCAQDPISVCNFNQLRGKILKTVDSVFAGISSIEECKQLCIDASFRCHSYDFGDTGNSICRLSHHSSATLSRIKEPYLFAKGANTYELGSCYNVSVECKADEMVARIKTNRIFNGKIYGKSRPNSCKLNVENSLEFELSLGFNDINCDVTQEIPGRFSTDVIIQHHDMIVTNADVGLKIRCNYNLENKTITNAEKLEVDGGLNAAETESTVIRSPNVTLRVTDRTGGDINSAKVGDPLALRFEIIEKGTPYEIFVRDLIAMDGQDSSEILLIDDAGCPTDYSIMGVMEEVNNSGQTLQANFDAFKFPTSDIVQFRALVTPCIPRCDPVRCDVTDFFGREASVRSFGKRSIGRARRQASSPADKDDFMVAGAIRISDKFVLEKKSSNTNWEPVSSDKSSVATCGQESHCWSSFSFTMAATLFLLAQCVLIGFWTFIYYKRKQLKSAKEDEMSADEIRIRNSSVKDYDPYFTDLTLQREDDGQLEDASMVVHCHKRHHRENCVRKQKLSESSLSESGYSEPRSM